MKKLRPFLLPIMFLLVLLPTACGSSDPNHVTIVMEAMQFDAAEVVVQAGQLVTLRIVNKDGYSHALDIDEFDVHLSLAANEITEVTFTPNENGRFLIYCGSPGHQEAGMVSTLVAAP